MCMVTIVVLKTQQIMITIQLLVIPIPIQGPLEGEQRTTQTVLIIMVLDRQFILDLVEDNTISTAKETGLMFQNVDNI